jgi:hypothetical protein
VAVIPALCTAKKLFALLAERALTSARALSQSVRIGHAEAAPTIAYEVVLLKLTGQHRNAGALHAEHLCEIFLRHCEFASAGLVLRTQQPRAQPLKNEMTGIASCKLTGLAKEVLILRPEQAPEFG